MSVTPVAVLGTLAEFHKEPIPYDLNALVRLVSNLHPDLLCLDMTSEQWRQRDFGGLPPEYREALLPLAYQTDIVVAPIAGENPPAELSAVGWRAGAIATLRRWLAILQRTAPGPDAINQGLRHHVADLLYSLSAWLDGPAARQKLRDHTERLTQAVLELARRDPDARILVVVNVRHCHIIRQALRKYPEIQGQLSNLGHWVEGLLLAVVGILALLNNVEGAGWAGIAWPILLLVAGILLLILIYPRHPRVDWPLIWNDSQQRQHTIMALAITVAGAAELAGGLSGR